MQRSNKIFFIGVVAALLASGILLSQARHRAATAEKQTPAAAPLTGRSAAEAMAIERARAATTTSLALDEAPLINVYKTPTCGCCTAWIEHLRKHGFEVEAHDLPNLSQVKERLGVHRSLESCHTAEIDGYVVEGHVPADLIERMIVERPEIAGLAVPGMPMGSPGMEGPYTDRYDVIAFERDGGTTVYDRR